MELKDMILSTLAELEDVNEENKEEIKQEPPIEKSVEIQEETVDVLDVENEEACTNILEDEKHFCESMRERILVLFEGFQSPNNKSIEAKVDLTLNFLEYLLAVIDERLESLDKKEK
ncbi:CiaD-like domain-containing protein [Sulfurospirillum arcachonense]|uniref:CiaD-like domain-containing protein n=1 Tax=Sulfurospirillum arcachonense TaxID=57666 RepID=UPI000467FC93|nr:hypothetical protein [Sulfurospirillum arcachonense]